MKNARPSFSRKCAVAKIEGIVLFESDHVIVICCLVILSLLVVVVE